MFRISPPFYIIEAPRGGSLPAGPSGGLCRSTKYPKRGGAQPLWGCIGHDDAILVGLTHLACVMPIYINVSSI